MRNLKRVLSVLLICLFAHIASAQGSYIKVNIGYGFPMNAQDVEHNYTTIDNIRTYERSSLSFGKGLNFGGAYGYMFTENIGVELGLSYLKSDKSIFTSTSTTTLGVKTYSAEMFRLSTSLVFAYDLKKINIYSKLGFLIGSAVIDTELSYVSPSENVYATLEDKGGFAFGANTAVGLSFKVYKQISFFSELNIVSMSYAPEKQITTSIIYNGEEQIAEWDKSQLDADYVNSYTTDSDNPSPTTEPRKELKQWFSFSSIGLNVGLKIKI